MTHPPVPPAGDPSADASVATASPFVASGHWTDKCREKFVAGSCRRRLWDTLFLPVRPPSRFTESHADIVGKLTVSREDGEIDEDRAKETLEEAQGHFDAAEERVSGAQTRATTLQGAVAVAGSLVVAGGALLADRSKVEGDFWRIWLSLAVLGVVISLVMTGLRALAATSRIHVFHYPSPSNVYHRAQQPLGRARLELAAELFKDYSYNTKVADWKVSYLGAAAWWFRWALVLLTVLALGLSGYALFGTSTGTKTSPPATGTTV